MGDIQNRIFVDKYKMDKDIENKLDVEVSNITGRNSRSNSSRNTKYDIKFSNIENRLEEVDHQIFGHQGIFSPK